MTIVAAMIWVIGSMFGMGWCYSLYSDVPSASRKDLILAMLVSILIWPTYLGVSAEIRTR